MNAILALPIIYLIGFGGLALTNTFVVIIAFRFIQILWLSGIANSAYQAMFNAVPATRRDQVRAFIGGVPEQAGTFLAGIILIIGEQNFCRSNSPLLGWHLPSPPHSSSGTQAAHTILRWLILYVMAAPRFLETIIDPTPPRSTPLSKACHIPTRWYAEFRRKLSAIILPQLTPSSTLFMMLTSTFAFPR